jgi:tryptophan-rich sensory protein
MPLPYIVAIVSTLLVLGIGGAATRIDSWYRERLKKPSWNPPNWVFGPAWTAILSLAAWAGVLAWDATDELALHKRILVLYGINILFHLAWSPLFFNLRRPDWALIELPFLWISILMLMIGLSPIVPAALWLLMPYLLWVTFAGYLNLTIVRMNYPFSENGRKAD